MEYTVKQLNGETRMIFSGSLTFETIKEMQAALASILKEAQSVTLDFSTVQEADISCLQLLCSAHRTAGTLGKSLQLAENRSAAFQQAAQAAGYQRHIGCALDRMNSCFWVERREKGKSL